ncbi:MAG: hypothetical protein IJX62_01900, partial [Clostridia bacterium]|nr:hypothetical protein [Clostridia bacterium]
NKLNDLNFGEKTAYTKGSTNLPETVNNWLFNATARKQYEVTSITVDEGIYLLAFYSEKGNANAVEARIKFYEFGEGASYKGDDIFKTSIYNQLLAQRQAENLEEALTHTDADVNTILADNIAKEVTGVDKNNTEVPEVLRDAVLASTVKAESVVTASEFGVQYVAYVRSVENGKADFAYCTFGVTTSYRSAAEKVEEMHDELESIDSDKESEIEAWLDAHDAIEKTGVTSSTPSSTVPTAITKAVTASGVKGGDVLSVSGTYVVYVYGIDAGKAKIAYVEPKADTYYEIFNNLNTSLDEVYPATKSAAFVSEPKKDSLDAWLSQKEEGDGFVGARHEFDTTVIETTETKDGKETKTYTAYMVINTPMYLAMDTVYNGGYLKFTDSTSSDKEQKPPHATQAAEALKELEGKEGYALRDALLALDSSASTSVSYAESTFTDANLKAWFLDEDRKANDVAIITSEDGKTSYLVIFHEKMLSWQRSAKTNYVSEQLEGKIDELTKDYSVNEKFLKKLGELQTTTETTGETTAA